MCIILWSTIFLFQSFRGVRKGENLSPILFAILLNDLESFMANNGATGVNLDLRYYQLTISLKILDCCTLMTLLYLVLTKINFKLNWTYFVSMLQHRNLI